MIRRSSKGAGGVRVKRVNKVNGLKTVKGGQDEMEEEFERKG